MADFDERDPLASRRLVNPSFLAFPFRVDDEGPRTSRREQHVAEIIEQVLFTEPRERVFRPHFGAGVRGLVFEPNSSALAAATRDRLAASLAEALLGEVDPRTNDIDVEAHGERLILAIGYKLAAFDRVERHRFDLTRGAAPSGADDRG